MSRCAGRGIASGSAVGESIGEESGALGSGGRIVTAAPEYGMNAFERRVRAAVIQSLRDTSRAPSTDELARSLDASPGEISGALRSLENSHRLALRPRTDDVWMAHPFSAVPTDFVVTIGERRWFANCVWDGLAILGLLGDGALDTHSPQSTQPIRFVVTGGQVQGDGLVHFLVPARSFWDNIGFT